MARHRKLVRVLLNTGANAKTVLNDDGKSPLDIAKDNDDGETAVMLLSGSRQHSSTRSRGRKNERTDHHHQRSHSEPRKQDLKELHGRKESLSSGGSKNPVLQRPKSATLPRKSYVQARAKWKRHERQKFERYRENQNIFEKHQHEITVNPFVVPQLYSLYRDCHGNVRQQPVIDQLPNPTPEIVTSITTAVANTKGELLQEMKKTNNLLEKRLDQLENHTDFKVAKLDQITKERIHAERMQCLHRIDRRAMLERVVSSCDTTVVHNDRPKKYKSSMQPQTSCDKKTLNTDTHGSDLHGNFAKGPREASADKDHPLTQEIDKSTNSNYRSLQPYKTIKITGGTEGSSSWCNSTGRNGIHVTKQVSGSMNCSDSAYGSLSPRPVLNSSTFYNKSFAGASTDLRARSARCFNSMRSPTNMYHSTLTLPESRQRHNFNSFSEGEPEVVTNFTQQVFENATQVMEDWYERRLQDITVRQQQEMDRRVAELENKMKLLQSSAGNSNRTSGYPTEDDFV